MKAKVIVSMIFSLCFNYLQAQTLDDFGKIALQVQVADKKMSDEAKEMLENKMKQIVTHFGMGSMNGNFRFVMEAKVDILSKDITATAPQKVSQKLEITFYVGDVTKQKIFSNVSINCVGVGTNETKSFITAIQQINSKNEKFKVLLEEAKNEIISFYNTECVQILKEAQSLSERGKHDEAIYKLALVPDVCAECYTQSLKMQSTVFTQKIEVEGKSIFVQAKTIWAEQPNSNGAAKIAQLLPRINPQVSFMQNVQAFIAEISAAVQAQELREWEQQVKEYNDSVAEARRNATQQYQLEQQRIRAYREIAVEYAKNQPKEIYNTLIIW
jgi:hypothetical protein